MIVEGSHRLINRLFRDLPPGNRLRKQKGLKHRFSGSHPWLAELTGKAGDSQERIQRFMQESAEINGVPVRVIELTGEPGDAVLCHESIFHAISYNRADVPRFMRVGRAGKRDLDEPDSD